MNDSALTDQQVIAPANGGLIADDDIAIDEEDLFFDREALGDVLAMVHRS